MKHILEQFISYQDEDRASVGKSQQSAYIQSKAVITQLADFIGPASECTEKKLADFFRAMTASQQRNHRHLLSAFISHAMIEGAIQLTHNVFQTQGTCFAGYKKRQQKQRQRLTMEQFNAIHAIAPAYLKSAMELSLLLGFRRGDICDLQFDHIQNGMIRKVILKSEAKLGAQGSHKQITLADNKPVLAIVNRCAALRNNATHLIHHPSYAQIQPEQLSKAFQKYRDRAGLFNNTPAAQRPTFHEIRALHVHVRITAGEQLELVQHDAAHQNPAMTKAYAEGHEIDWQPLNVSPAIEEAFNESAVHSFTLTSIGSGG